MKETWVLSLGQEDPLEKGMALHSSILAWRSPWTEEPGELQFLGLQTVRHDWATKLFTFFWAAHSLQESQPRSYPVRNSSCPWETLRLQTTRSWSPTACAINITKRTWYRDQGSLIQSFYHPSPNSIYCGRERTAINSLGSDAYLIWGKVGEEVFSICGYSHNALALPLHFGLFGREVSSS